MITSSLSTKEGGGGGGEEQIKTSTLCAVATPKLFDVDDRSDRFEGTRKSSRCLIFCFVMKRPAMTFLIWTMTLR